jgi:hypothetical protein
MGAKQKAFIAAIVAAEQHCEDPIATLAKSIVGIQEIDKRILAEKVEAKKDALVQAKQPFGMAMLKARTQLQAALPPFKESIRKLDEFIKEKSKRWVGKSTLSEAQTMSKGAHTRLDLYNQLVTESLGLSLRN